MMCSDYNMEDANNDLMNNNEVLQEEAEQQTAKMMAGLRENIEETSEQSEAPHRKAIDFEEITEKAEREKEELQKALSAAAVEKEDTAMMSVKSEPPHSESMNSLSSPSDVEFVTQETPQEFASQEQVGEQQMDIESHDFEVIEKAAVEEEIKQEENQNRAEDQIHSQDPTHSQNEMQAEENQAENSLQNQAENSLQNQAEGMQVEMKKSPPGTLIREQLKYCSSLLRSIRKHKDVGPFLLPVDPIALGIPDYFTVIKQPMDISTIAKKLEKCEYESPEAFIDDFRLMIANCFAYNAPETTVYKMGQSIEKQFNNLLSKMPTEVPSLADLDSSNAKNTPRKRRMTGDDVVFSKRKDSIGGSSKGTPRQSRRGSGKESNAEEMKWCLALWRDLTKKANQTFMWPFMQPVDAIALGIPDYYDVIKNPMDFSTIKKKLDAKQYSNADEFSEDVRMVFNNCYTYNAAGTDIVAMCRMAETLFNQKMAAKPIFSAYGGEGSDEDDFSDSEMNERYAILQQQLESIKQEMEAIQRKRRGRASRPKRESLPPAAYVETPKMTPSAKPPRVKKEVKQMSFEEKKQLSIDINQLSADKLGRVVEIIHASMPHLKDSAETDEIELDIDSLDAKTLNQLADYVMECQGRKKTKAVAASARKEDNSGSSSSEESD